jgi:hypothetical protein
MNRRFGGMHILSEAIPDVIDNRRAVPGDNVQWFVLNTVILTKK